MIFLTVGTHDPFDRLVCAVDQWCDSRNYGDRVFGQITEHAGYQPSSFEWVSRLDRADYVERCREAALMVSHAGMGSIISAMSLGKPIVIMPRRAHLGEQRNDHQRATAERFGSRRGIHVATETKALWSLLDRFTSSQHTQPGGSVGLFADGVLIDAIREFIHNPNLNSNVESPPAPPFVTHSDREADAPAQQDPESDFSSG